MGRKPGSDSALRSSTPAGQSFHSRQTLCTLQGATVLQLFPYGWGLPDGSVVREQVYRGMAEAANATYLRWINPDVGNSHFRKCAPDGLLVGRHLLFGHDPV